MTPPGSQQRGQYQLRGQRKEGIRPWLYCPKTTEIPDLDTRSRPSSAANVPQHCTQQWRLEGRCQWTPRKIQDVDNVDMDMNISIIYPYFILYLLWTMKQKLQSVDAKFGRSQRQLFSKPSVSQVLRGHGRLCHCFVSVEIDRGFSIRCI